jgi:hypothetical protein
MSATTQTTPPLFLIQSKVDQSDWVLTVKGSGSSRYVRLNHNSADESQLWLREEDAARGGFFLRNPFLDLCLRAGSSQGGGVTMAAKTMSDAELIWRKEGDADWGCLNKLSDWEQKLNIAGDGPYDDNSSIVQYEYDRGSDHEMWKLVQYEPNFGSTDVVYNEQSKAVVLGDPISAAVTNIENSSTTASVTTSVTLRTSVQKTMTHSVSDQTQHALTVAQKFGGKFSIDKVFEVSEEGSVTATRTTSRTVGDQTSNAETIDVSVSANVVVPAGKSYDVTLMVRHCTLTVPYTATITRRTVSGGAGTSYQINGTYQYTSAYRYDLKVTDKATQATVTNAVSQVAVQQ